MQASLTYVVSKICHAQGSYVDQELSSTPLLSPQVIDVEESD